MTRCTNARLVVRLARRRRLVAGARAVAHHARRYLRATPPTWEAQERAVHRAARWARLSPWFYGSGAALVAALIAIAFLEAGR